MCGVVEDGIVPGLYGYEAGQSGVGDIFAWFVENGVPPVYHEQAKARGIPLHELLEEEAAKQKPGEHGLLALDWWNGNRSTLVDVELSGLLVGATWPPPRRKSTARCWNPPPLAHARSSRRLPKTACPSSASSPRAACRSATSC